MCCCIGSVIATILAFTVYIGKYAFDNPNPDAWYIDGQLVPAEPTLEGAEFTAVHDQYVTWFLWGFINQMIFLASPLCALLTKMMPNDCQWHTYVTGCGVCLSSIVWYIIGLVWRFNAVGKFSCGDETEVVASAESITLMQNESGNFMRIYFLITWICLSTICCCAISGFAFAQCCAK